MRKEVLKDLFGCGLSVRVSERELCRRILLQSPGLADPANSLWRGELGGLFDRARVSRGVLLVCRGEVVDFLKPAHDSSAATSEQRTL